MDKKYQKKLAKIEKYTARITAYRAALARLYGPEIAEKTYIVYMSGWYTISLAYKGIDHRLHIRHFFDHVRSSELERMTAELNKREGKNGI